MTARPTPAPSTPHPRRPHRAPLTRHAPHVPQTPQPTSAAPDTSGVRVTRTRYLHARNLRGHILIALLALVYTLTTRTGQRFLVDHIKSATVTFFHGAVVYNVFPPGIPITNVMLSTGMYLIFFFHFRTDQTSIADEYTAQHIRARHDLLGDTEPA